MTYEKAMSLPTLEERTAALEIWVDQPRIRLLRLFNGARIWLARKVAPRGYFDE